VCVAAQNFPKNLLKGGRAARRIRRVRHRRHRQGQSPGEPKGVLPRARAQTATDQKRIIPPTHRENPKTTLVKRFYLRKAPPQDTCHGVLAHAFAAVPVCRMKAGELNMPLAKCDPKTPPPLERSSVPGASSYGPSREEADDVVESSDLSPVLSGKHEAQGWAPNRSSEGAAAPQRAQAQPHLVRPGVLRARRCSLPWARNPRMNFAPGHTS
jgi:hypothetical protein